MKLRTSERGALQEVAQLVPEPHRWVTYPCPDDVRHLKLVATEVTTMCPVLGNPDFYTVEISYVPSTRVLCTKALKKWFQTQRGEFHSAETFTQATLDSCWKALVEAEAPAREMEVVVRQNPRGAISIDATAARYG